MVPQIFYSANFYADRSVVVIRNHTAATAKNKSAGLPQKPLFLYLPIQSVHFPYQMPPTWETLSFPTMWSGVYAETVSHKYAYFPPMFCS